MWLDGPFGYTRQARLLRRVASLVRTGCRAPTEPPGVKTRSQGSDPFKSSACAKIDTVGHLRALLRWPDPARHPGCQEGGEQESGWKGRCRVVRTAETPWDRQVSTPIGRPPAYRGWSADPRLVAPPFFHFSGYSRTATPRPPHGCPWPRSPEPPSRKPQAALIDLPACPLPERQRREDAILALPFTADPCPARSPRLSVEPRSPMVASSDPPARMAFAAAFPPGMGASHVQVRAGTRIRYRNCPSNQSTGWPLCRVWSEGVWGGSRAASNAAGTRSPIPSGWQLAAGPQSSSGAFPIMRPCLWESRLPWGHH